MMEKIRLGVVGLGSRGKGMFDLALRIDGVKAAALCDCNPEMLEPLREKYPQACFFEDFDEMLESGKIDTLLVETPAENHAKFCAAGLERGVNVFSDIPTVATIAEAEMLWQVARNSSAMFMRRQSEFLGLVEAMVTPSASGCWATILSRGRIYP